MADNTLVKVGLFSGAAFLAYRYGLFSFLGLTPAATTSAPAPSPAAGPAPAASAPAPAPLPSLDQIGRNTQAAATAAGAIGPNNRMLSPDAWNSFANQGTPGLPALPDPIPLFGSRDPITFGFWWQKTMGVLQAAGLAGYLRSRGVRV